MGKRNENFIKAYHYLKSNGMIKSQEDLAKKIGVNKNTISRIRLNQNEVGHETLSVLNEKFGGIFNIAWLLGESEEMLAPKKPANPTENMLELYAHMIRSLDDLRIELKNELAEIRTIKSELQQARNDYHLAIQQLNRGNAYHDDLHLVAAEDTSNPNEPQA